MEQYQLFSSTYVVQREGFVPQRAHEHEAGGAALGFADVTIRGQCPHEDAAVTEYRVLMLAGAYGRDADWQSLDVQRTGDQFQTQAHIAAGGWYRLEVRFRQGDHVLAQGGVEPLGVGEVFVVAGQSYATNCNDEVGEGCIRAAIDALWHRPGFAPGPDTDILGGENRGGPTTFRHFSAVGQRRAAALWFAAVWQQLNHP